MLWCSTYFRGRGLLTFRPAGLCCKRHVHFAWRYEKTDGVTEGGCGAGQINKLLGHFQNQTGSSFTGGQDQFDQIAAMASKYTGFPIPASILRKLCVPCSLTCGAWQRQGTCVIVAVHSQVTSIIWCCCSREIRKGGLT